MDLFRIIYIFSVITAVVINSPLYAAKKSACSAAIARAAAAGDHEGIKKELAKGIKPDCVYIARNSEEGDIDLTPLMITARNAAYSSYIKAASLLIDSGAEIDDKHKNGGTALTLAAVNGHTAMTEFLLNKGANPDVNDGFALHGAATNGHIAVVKLLLDKGAGVNIRDYDGTTPVFLAVRNNRKEIINMLLAKGADVTITDNKEGNSILHNAVRYSDIELFKELIRRGADPGAFNFSGESVLFCLLKERRNDQLELVKLLVESGANVNAKVKYIAPGKSNEKKGTDVNTGSDSGSTPLMQAVKYTGNNPEMIEIIRYLISKGADVNAKDNEGNTPLSLASSNRVIADILIQAGAKD